MATDSITAVRSAVDPSRPYPPSWLDRTLEFLSGLPGPTWLAYLGLTVVSVIVASSAFWLSGLRPVGDFEPVQVGWGVAAAVLLAASHRLKVVAGAAFDDFRPALGNAAVDPEEARYSLTVMPARPMLLIGVFSLVITPVYYLADPVASQVVGLTAAGFVPRIISEGATSAILLGIVYQAIRQMRIVGRLHEAADGLDPFRPVPLHAFSRLTSQVGLVLIGFNAVGIVLNPAIFASAALIAFWVPWLAAFTIFAVAVFVVPLLGMHRRLEEVKLGLQGDADERLKAILAQLNSDVDSVELGRADAIQKTLTSLLQQREVLAKLPTWPWSGGTVRGFGSALLLPITVFFLQRLLLEVLSAR